MKLPKQNANLHGNAPDHARTVLIVIDVLNTMEFPGARALYRHALPMVSRLARLKRELKQKRIPAIYANDNFGKWKSDRSHLISRCLEPQCLGRSLAESLLPDDEDYFVLKPKHSAFFSTTLDTLLRYLGAESLVITGLSGNICVLHTAMDAHIRDYRLIVPEDCVASKTTRENNFALRQLKEVLHADTRASTHWIKGLKRGTRVA